MAKLRAAECREFFDGHIAASGGAAPVFDGSEMVGAYGISGGTSQQDEEMAVYARARVGWAHMSDVEPNEEVKAHINALYAQAGITDRKLQWMTSDREFP